MALRSCLCFTTTKRYALCIQRLTQAPLIRQPSLFYHTASVTKPAPVYLTKELTTGIERELQALLRQPHKNKRNQPFYQRLGQCTPQQIVHLFESMMAHHPYDRLGPIMVDAATHWDHQTLITVMKQCGTRYQQWRYDMFNSILLARYTLTRDLSAVMEGVPLEGKPTDVMPFYNAILVKSQKLKRHDHMDQIMKLMKERHHQPDTATYNILIREQLNKMTAGTSAMEWLDQLVDQGMVPSRVTYHIFIRHVIHHQQWDQLSVWLARMEQEAFQPNAVLVRILLKALVKYPQEPALVTAFEQTVKQAWSWKGEDREKLLNTAAAGLLASDQLETAMDILYLAMSKEPKSVYTYNLLLRGLCCQGNSKLALQVFKRMDQDDSIPQPDIVTYTTLIHGLVHNHHSLEQIVDLYQHMLHRGLQPNNVLQSTMLQAMIKSGKQQNLSTVFSMFQHILSSQHLLNEPLETMRIYNMMMDHYFLHYHKLTLFPQETLKLFMEAVDQKKLEPTVVTLNIMVRGLAILNKDLRAAEEVVASFKARGIDMNERTVWYLVKAAHRQGDNEKARQWISTFQKDHVIKGKGLLDLKKQLMP